MDWQTEYSRMTLVDRVRIAQPPATLQMLARDLAASCHDDAAERILTPLSARELAIKFARFCSKLELAQKAALA